MTKLGNMYSYCTGAICRHKAILRYFDQDLDVDSCNACDMCLGEFEYIDGALIIAQKILSCIVRLGQMFGGGYVSLVLIGSKDKRIIENSHDMLSTYGLLDDYSKHTVHDWIEQLTGADYIEKYGEYNVLRVTEKGRTVLKGLQTPRLLKPAIKKAKVKLSKAATDSWEGVDKELFEALRKLRSKIAGKKKIPAYVVFGDTALRDMARKRPGSLNTFFNVKGVGEKKCKKYGETFITAIKDYCSGHSLDMDVE
jgi:ATP-dependent DNA helicase RecQ